MTEQPSRVLVTDRELDVIESDENNQYQSSVRYTVRQRIARMREEIRQLENVDEELVGEAREAMYPAPKARTDDDVMVTSPDRFSTSKDEGDSE